MLSLLNIHYDVRKTDLKSKLKFTMDLRVVGGINDSMYQLMNCHEFILLIRKCEVAAEPYENYLGRRLLPFVAMMLGKPMPVFLLTQYQGMG